MPDFLLDDFENSRTIMTELMVSKLLSFLLTIMPIFGIDCKPHFPLQQAGRPVTTTLRHEVAPVGKNILAHPIPDVMGFRPE